MVSASTGLAIVVVGMGAMILTVVLDKRTKRSNLEGSRSFRATSSPLLKSEGGVPVGAQSQQIRKPQKMFGRMSALERRLKYAQLPISPVQFRLIILAATAIIYIGVGLIPRINGVVQLITAVCGGTLFVNSVVNRRIIRQFNAFDKDFAPFIMSFVGLLKSGMNLMAGMEAASERLGPDSLLRMEVTRVLERLRFGVNEDFALGSFAEGVEHPDIELFVQAMLLSKQVGGSLSNTLERLARQARRRAQFRMQAHAAVGQQKGSVTAILSIVVLVQVFLFFQMPEMILGALKSDIGFLVWQVAILVAWFAIWLMGKIAKIKV